MDTITFKCSYVQIPSLYNVSPPVIAWIILDYNPHEYYSYKL